MPLRIEKGTPTMGVKDGIVAARACLKVCVVAEEEASIAHSWVPPWLEGQRISAR